MVQELERQKKFKHLQDKVRGELMVVVNTDRLPQALRETKTEIQNMLTANPAQNQFYEQLAHLNGNNSKVQSQVSSREQLKVKDMIYDPLNMKKPKNYG